MIIYLIENKKNGKKYVGLSRYKNGIRWRDHVRRSKKEKPHQLIDRKIKEYGLDNFEYSVICERATIEELKEKEIHYISKLSTYVGTGKGYNLTFGGDGCFGFKMTPEQIAKMSGKNNHVYGKSHTEESNIKRSNTMKEHRKNSVNPFTLPAVRKVVSEYAKRRIGKLNSNYRHSITKKDLVQYYRSHTFKETVEYFRCSEATLVRRLKSYGISKRTV